MVAGSMPRYPTARQRLIPILPPAILDCQYPGVIECSFGECAQVGSCQLAILVLGECLGLAVRHMRQEPVPKPFTFGDGLVDQRLAGMARSLEGSWQWTLNGPKCPQEAYNDAGHTAYPPQHSQTLQDSYIFVISMG